MADAFITKLSNIREIVVRPTSAVHKYTGQDRDPMAIGRELAVEAVLEGNIQKLGDRVRITVQLVSVSDGRPLWAAKFDEKFTDIFSIQDSISGRVAEALTVQLTGESRKGLEKRYTENEEAYQLCSRGPYLWEKATKEDLLKAVAYKAYAEGDPSLNHLNVEPRLKSIRSDPRFQNLLERMRLGS